jgi:hypothetical protein
MLRSLSDPHVLVEYQELNADSQDKLIIWSSLRSARLSIDLNLLENTSFWRPLLLPE